MRRLVTAGLWVLGLAAGVASSALAQEGWGDVDWQQATAAAVQGRIDRGAHRPDRPLGPYTLAPGGVRREPGTGGRVAGPGGGGQCAEREGRDALARGGGSEQQSGGRRPAGGPGGRSHRAGSVRQDALGRMEPRLDEAPSVYFQRQFWATFEDDRAGILTREMLGVDRLMWGADYPHTEGTFPRSQEQIARDFAGIPEDEVYQMVVGNAAKLYGLEVLS